MGRVNHLWFHLFIVFSVATIVPSADDCVYTVYVRTGSILKGGTDGLDHQPHSVRRQWLGNPDSESQVVGWANGPELLREGQSGHL
ncbi:hypothetical protein F0562_003241 [Nyssa sinensis]|uniref:Secreted protein n=1 Tax=Nyssa sinensis TaxID=561372 RepID=A0A5J5BUW4_9ASTE|nr:hypothetical protein F0562_003241 [Nyssa sinensis]